VQFEGWGVLLRDVLVFADNAALIYFLALNSFYAFLLILSIPELWRHWQVSEDAVLQRLIASDVLPPVSILVPAYNEEMTIGASVLSFLSLKYPRLEVILVNDGSRDRTVDVLIEQFNLYQVPPAYRRNIETKKLRGVYRSRTHSRLIVIDKDNGGKADSLNAALNAARHPFVLAVDADTLIESDALLRLARPFVLGTSVAAVGGTIRVVNECIVEMGRVVETRVARQWLAGCQVVEYLRAFLFGRLAWNRLGGNLVISGAFGLFRRKYMLAIGGYRTGNVTEDMDLAVRMHRYLRENKIKAEMPFIPDPVAWTEVPSDIKVLGRQRERWHRGLIGTMLAYKGMIFNPKYGMTGMIAMPFFVFGELIAPIVEVIGVVLTLICLSIGAIGWQFGLLFFAVAAGYGTLLSIWAVVLEEVSFRRYKRRSDFLRLLGFAFIEGLGFRQLTVWFRLQAFWKYFRGVESWGAMTRKGFAGAKKG
jgi:cellulose synthase/poly-beta-1,6-N-acetylglucosamine synthase-like glycosyltransferase